MSNYKDKNIVLAFIGKIVTTIIGIAFLFVIGIVIAACVQHSTFTVEWANMIAWFSTWAK